MRANGGWRVLLGRAGEGAELQFSVEMLYEGDPSGSGGSRWWFKNVNTPEDLAEAEAWVCGMGGW